MASGLEIDDPMHARVLDKPSVDRNVGHDVADDPRQAPFGARLRARLQYPASARVRQRMGQCRQNAPGGSRELRGTDPAAAKFALNASPRCSNFSRAPALQSIFREILQE